MIRVFDPASLEQKQVAIIGGNTYERCELRASMVYELLEKKLPDDVIYMSDCFNARIDSTALEKYSDSLLLTFNKQ